ncbi:MAG: MBL fold metallo-hydrolase [Methanothrix sp.]|nr:MBL fold metallo-hydrolase [Methanothrix sp.]
MILERFVSQGLAHYSYLLGDGGHALVIDPRRDCEAYQERAGSLGMRIVHILETHRNEDYFVGSAELAARTGAQVWHADSQWGYGYGQPARPGQRWRIGRLEVEAISTPGHTPGSMSYLLRDPEGNPWMVFTGDALFAGEVGRVDLLGEEMAGEMAGMLYESIFERLLPLGDGIIVCPAHGAGSVCGESIAERSWTTIGLERAHNPRLQLKERSQFVAAIQAVRPERPPYFRMMERVNLEGRPLLGRLPSPPPLSAEEFEERGRDAQILDTRTETSFGAAHLPGAQSIWQEGLAAFAGWFLRYDQPLLLVTEAGGVEEATRLLIRLGFDGIEGFLSGGMLGWHMSGRESASIRMITVQELCRLLDREEALVLDVRSSGELSSSGTIRGAQHIHLTMLPERMDEVPRDRTVHIFCGSGLRAMVAASFLKRHGWRDLAVVLGGMAGWRSRRCPVVR